MIAGNILVTGPPRSGKSTLIEKAIQRIQSPMTGFLTSEISEGGNRIGFSITTLDGKTGILAYRGMKSRFKVGGYGVNLRDLDRVAVPSMVPAKPEEVIIIDEIGKMECFSRLFKETLIEALDSKHRVIGSIAMKGDRFIQRIKERDDVRIISLSESNRASALELLLDCYKHQS